MEARNRSTWGLPLQPVAFAALVGLLTGCSPSSPGVDNSIGGPVPVSMIVALTCHLKSGAHAEIGPRIGKYKRDSGAMELTFTEFDWPNRRARVIGNQGAAVVEARLEGPQVQMVFLERAPLGSTMMTSVFLTPATDEIPALTNLEAAVVKGKQASVVHSRHVMWLGGASDPKASVSQSIGVCDIKF